MNSGVVGVWIEEIWIPISIQGAWCTHWRRLKPAGEIGQSIGDRLATTEVRRIDPLNAPPLRGRKPGAAINDRNPVAEVAIALDLQVGAIGWATREKLQSHRITTGTRPRLNDDEVAGKRKPHEDLAAQGI